jgi:Peptidase A4 family
MDERRAVGDDEPVRVSVRPAMTSTVSVATRPWGVCSVRVEDAAQPEHRLQLFADSAGVVAFQVRPDSESPDVVSLTVECATDGQLSVHPVELRLADEPTDEFPAPTRPGAHLNDRERRYTALTPAEIIDLSDSDVLARGYPPRPDSRQAPEAFRAWRRVVSVPAIRVESALIAHPELRAGAARLQAGLQENTTNWSGFELRGPQRHGVFGPVHPFAYDMVMGEWIVPSPLHSAIPAATTYSTLWVGLDGDGIADLWQAGTEQDCLVSGPGSIRLALGTSFAWTELLPQQQTMQVVPDLPVSIGDELYVCVWVGDEEKPPNVQASTGRAYLHNITAGRSALITVPLSRAGQVSGTEAEWIMERPLDTTTNSLRPLADYGSAVMRGAIARRTTSPPGSGYVACQDDPNIRITMRGSSGQSVLSYATALDASSIRFDFGDPRFGSVAHVV